MHVLILKTRVLPEKVELYESTFRELREKVLRLEPGVSFYELCRVPDQPNHYRLVEAYADDATQEEHLDTDYYREAREIIDTCLDGPFEMEICSPV